LASLGVEQIFHKVKIKPGNPLWFGRKDKAVVFGLPGNPVSVQVGFKVFIEPYIRACFNLEKVNSYYFELSEDKKSRSAFTEYFACKLKSSNNKTILIPNNINSSGDISATLYSDGIAIHPEGIETLSKGTMVEFLFWNN